MVPGKRCASLAAIGLACGLGACTVGPDFAAPESGSPATWTDPSATPAAKVGSGGVTVAAEPVPRWWRSFDDPQLSALIDRAIAGNLDLQQTVLRIAAARASEIATAAAGLPSLSGTGSYTREQLGLKGLLQEHGAYGLANRFPEAGPILNQLTKPVDLYQAGFDASWELDLFGRVRRSVEQSQAESEAQIETRNDALVTLEGDVARAYAQLRGAQAETATGRETLQTEEDILGLTRSRRESGLAPQGDVESALAARATTQSQLPQYERQAEQAIHRLSVLIGEPPGALLAELETAKPLPPLPPDVPIGLPASLARRRPDIRAAEARLHAATAAVGVAVAQLFPDVSLTGSVGLRSERAKYLARWSNLFYSYGPSVSVPVFEGGRLSANVTIAEADAAVAALDYRKAVLNALEDVENALAAYRTDQAQRQSLADTVAANGRALAFARERYRGGLASFIEVLTTELNWAQSRQQLIAATLAQMTDLVALYKALGGGWQKDEELPQNKASGSSST